ncbi:MAG: hypothetical protein WHS46_14120 [Desulfosoma sp.]
MQNQSSHPIQFWSADSRQRRIIEGLQLVGPGPAAFFRDACSLMANPHQLENTVLLVGHLLRELESALRHIFRPVTTRGAGGTRESECQEQQKQKEEIRAILRCLDISERSREGIAWLKLATNLHRLAHRKGLDAPRSLEDISEIWDQSQALLDVLIQSLRTRFLDWIHVLDELLKKPSPNNNDLKRIAQEVPNNTVTRQYFFDRLEDPKWLNRLRKKGFFKQPPPPVFNEKEGTKWFPPWAEGRYLARMAQHKPELVAKIILEMDDTDNAAVQADLLDAMLAMPPEISVKLIDKAKRYAERPFLQLVDKLPQLIECWGKGGQTDEALNLARVLLDVHSERTSVETEEMRSSGSLWSRKRASVPEVTRGSSRITTRNW